MELILKGEMNMKVKDIKRQIEHIEKEIVNLKRLYDLEESLMYRVEEAAKLDSSLGITLDVSIDVMNSWVKVLKERIDETEVEI